MKKNNSIKIIIFSLIALIAIGIGYSIISNINLFVNGSGGVSVNQSNFKVKFLNTNPNMPTIDGSPANTISIVDDTTASFNVSTLSKKGDIVNAIIKVKNESIGIGARISLDVSNSNQEYFNVEEYVDDCELEVGDITYVRVSIEMIKAPANNTVSTNIVAKLIADPLEKARDDYSNAAGFPYQTIYCTGCYGSLEGTFEGAGSISYSGNVRDVIETYPAGLKLKLDNDMNIYSADIEVLFDSNSYLLKGSKSSDSSDVINANYLYNKSIIDYIYGEENCYYDVFNGFNNVYMCDNDNREIYPLLFEHGAVAFVDTYGDSNISWQCYIDPYADEYHCDY